MNDGKRSKQFECDATAQPVTAIAAGAQPLRIDLGQWRCTIWHDDCVAVSGNRRACMPGASRASADPSHRGALRTARS